MKDQLWRIFIDLVVLAVVCLMAQEFYRDFYFNAEYSFGTILLLSSIFLFNAKRNGKNIAPVYAYINRFAIPWFLLNLFIIYKIGGFLNFSNTFSFFATAIFILVHWFDGQTLRGFFISSGGAGSGIEKIKEDEVKAPPVANQTTNQTTNSGTAVDKILNKLDNF